MVSENVSSTTGSSRGAAVRDAITPCALLRPTLHARLARASDAPVGASRRSIACAWGCVPVPCTWKTNEIRIRRRRPRTTQARRSARFHHAETKAAMPPGETRDCEGDAHPPQPDMRSPIGRPGCPNRRLGTLAKPRRERVERRQRGQRFAIARAVAGQFSNLLKLLYNPLGNGVTVAQQTLTLFV